MENNSLIKNISYNMINQIVGLIVPLISAPYVARIFNAELIGAYSFALANCSYFVLLENLGLTLYGQIKVASIRGDIKERSKVFREISILKLALMGISLVMYISVVFSIDSIIAKKLGAIMLINLVANGIDVTWFFNGLEAFKTIAVRNIFIRIISLLLMILLVKNENDIFLYAVIMQGSTFVAYLSVLPLLRRYLVSVSGMKLCLKQHMKPALVYFIPGFVTTVFSSTDKSMLGFMCNNYEVGVYEQANKISHICMSAISAIGNTIMPRATYLYHQETGKHDADKLLYSSLKIVLFVSLPVAFGISAIAYEFIPLFFGPGYEKSVLLLNILSFNVAFTALGNLIGQQCLISRDKQGKYNTAVSASAVINILLNFIFIKGFQSEGAALASVFASIVSLGMIILMCRKDIDTKKIFNGFFKYIAASIFMYILVKKITFWKTGTIIGVSVHVSTGVIIYVILVKVFALLLKEGKKDDI